MLMNTLPSPDLFALIDATSNDGIVLEVGGRGSGLGESSCPAAIEQMPRTIAISTCRMFFPNPWPLVFRGPLDVVHGEYVHRALGRLQLETKLFLKSREDRRRVRWQRVGGNRSAPGRRLHRKVHVGVEAP